MKLAGVLGNFKRWLDGEDPISTASTSEGQLSEWDEFFVRIAREVEAVMKREMFTPPGGPTYLPVEYIIYLSREDDLLWQGRKREGLEEGLRSSLTQRARELVGERVLKSSRIAISLGVDGTLERGEVRVQEVWDAESPRTEITPRRGGIAPDERPGGMALATLEAEQTMIRPRGPQFEVKWWTGSSEPKSLQVYKAKIEIGRGSKDFQVDLKLEGDQEVSRRHVLLEKVGPGEFRLNCVGRNPIELEGREIKSGESVTITPGRTFRVGLYFIRVDEGDE